MLHPPVFLPGVGNMPLQRGSSCTAAPSSLCHALPLICTVCSSCLGHDTSDMGCVFHKSVSDRKSRSRRAGVINPVAVSHDPILTVLDLPTDSESCGCNLLYKAERHTSNHSATVRVCVILDGMTDLHCLDFDRKSDKI